MTTFAGELTNKEQGVQHGCAAEIIPIEPDTDNTGEGKSLMLYKVRDGFMSYDAFLGKLSLYPHTFKPNVYEVCVRTYHCWLRL